ncbi:MAG: CaiB/BaiF CoA transferase family protein [Dehalococcoidia bacterium]
MGALDGLRVVDFGQYIAGPMCAMLLADQGADVVRVEPPGGPRYDSPGNRTWNRGKHSVTLDLKSPAGTVEARRLIAAADVVIENFRPGVMDRLGLGAESSRAANPGLVYCSLPGFAEDDPRATVAAWEGVLGAATATYRARLAGGDSSRPVYTAIPISSVYGAFVGAVAIAAALNARETTGRGQRVSVPLFDATFTAMGSVGHKVHDPAAVQRRGGLGWVRQYRCKDGRWVMFHAANSRFIEQFVRAAGIEHWRADGLMDRANYPDNPDLEKLLIERMTALFLTRTALEWEDLVNAAGTPTAICRETHEWLQHPHAVATRMVTQIEDPVLGAMLQPGVTPRLDDTPGAISGPAPIPGTDSAIPSWAPAVASTQSAPPMSSALDGLKVLDLCIILAGPTCGRTLAEFGADVIKVDAPQREGGIAFHSDVNRGKRSILLDLKSDEGREVFWKLVDWADVVVQNYRAGALERIGLGFEEVRKRKPGIIYASLNAYGHGGPWEHRPGWEQLAQAASGMQMRYGGEQPVLAPFPVNDYGTGILGSFGVLLALLHKAHTGHGQQVRSALAYTAGMLQSPFFADYEGKTWDEPRGQDSLGSGPLHRLYEASDGWLFLALPESQLGALATVDGMPSAASLAPATREAALETAFKGATVESWVARLQAAGIGAHAAVSVPDLQADPWVRAHGLLLTREHDGLGLVTTNGTSARLSETPPQPGSPASRPGADAQSVLATLGLEDQLLSLESSGVVVTAGVRGG